MSEVKVFAPATVANLGPGFDILGLAVTDVGDTVTVRKIDMPQTVISAVHGADLPLDPQKNTAGIAADYVRRQIAPEMGVDLILDKGLPLASGLGSSAASAVAAAFAVNALFGAPLKTIELLPALLEAEAAVSGRHLDNVAPALLGGIVLVTGIEPKDVYQLPIGKRIFDLSLVLVTPNVAVPTASARAVLPQNITLKTSIEQTKAVACLMRAIYEDDVMALAGAMMQDQIVEPAREHLIPHFSEARRVALEHGALAAIISGAGPTVCMLATDEQIGERVGDAVQVIYDQNGIGAVCRVVKPAAQGARVL